MAQHVSLSIQEGLPFNRVIRVVDGKDIWSSLGDFEVRSELRKSKNTSSTLFAELHDFMVKSYDGNDIMITWSMTGEQVRTLSNGFYDVILSDVGTTDAKALCVLQGQFSISSSVTTAG